MMKIEDVPRFSVAVILMIPLGCAEIHYFEDRLEDTLPGEDSSPEDSGDARPCPPTLAERLTITEVAVDEEIYYVKPGYNNIAVTARVILARQPNGNPILAWLNAGMDKIHVTPLTEGYSRRGDDTIVPGTDLGGLVPFDDGFALLTRREDTGEDVALEADTPAMAAVLTRYQNGEERFAVNLTGTNGFDQERDYSNYLRGQLQWNGTKFGAYFEIRDGVGALREGLYGDKLVYVDEQGGFVQGGWRFETGTLTDLALLPEPDDFLALALPDGQPAPGLNLITPGDSQLLAREETWSGYSGGSFGGVPASADGYAIAWGSRGFDDTSAKAEKAAHDVAFLRLSSDRVPIGDRLWLTDTADVDETNVHIAPYGDEHLLLIWDAVDTLDCTLPGTCFGRYAGTYFQIFTQDGVPLSEKEEIPAPPTQEQSLARYDNGDPAFAFVTDNPDYSAPLDVLFDGKTPPRRTIRIAHLVYCETGSER
jgi:hypothetical protein